MNIQEWNACAYYQKGDKVLFNGEECFIPNTGIGYTPVAPTLLANGNYIILGEEHGEAVVDDTANKAAAAIKTLEHEGYQYNGGEYWKPPINGDKVKVCQKCNGWGKHKVNVWDDDAIEKTACRDCNGSGQINQTEATDPKPCETFSSLKTQIIREYLDAQQTEYK